MSAAKEAPIAVVAQSLARRASRGRPVRSAPAANNDDAPASPPANR